ncbi:hypothetical protein [Streptomyces hokutonensis]|uniref:hypothetical protein n=1 Tax=Streptomyces hokutonensis TaxID=1306990 RepID=UPI00037C940E|nr:hypothetical protein [Streptomyces hokutonensis]
MSGSVLALSGCLLLRPRPLSGFGLLLAGTYAVTPGLNGLTLGLFHGGTASRAASGSRCRLPAPATVAR